MQGKIVAYLAVNLAPARITDPELALLAYLVLVRVRVQNSPRFLAKVRRKTPTLALLFSFVYGAVGQVDTALAVSTKRFAPSVSDHRRPAGSTEQL